MDLLTDNLNDYGIYDCTSKDISITSKVDSLGATLSSPNATSDMIEINTRLTIPAYLNVIPVVY